MIKDLRFKIGYWFIGLLGYLFIGLFLSPAWGQTMYNKDYILKTQGINAVSAVTSNTDYQLRSTAGELNPEVLGGVNFKVRTGFENTASALPFSVSLSSATVDFGALNPTNPIVRTVILSVYSLSITGYSIIASEDHPLQMNPSAASDSASADGTKIPNTTCDNGECSQEKAGVWINTLTYGFGYRCDNIIGFNCDSSLSKVNFYKHFADISNGQGPQSVMAGVGSKNKDIRLSYKVNISGNQRQGVYNNIITYIAVPNF